MNQEEVIRNLQEELAQAEAQLTAIQRHRSNVLAMAAHDLRTPLAIIQGYSQLLAADLAGESDVAREYIANILAHAEALGKMIDNLITLDLLESGRITLNVSRDDLNGRVGTVLAQMEALAQLKEIAISYQPLPVSLQVEVDRVQIDRALYNLLSHVTKYARPGTELQIALARQDHLGRVTLTDPERSLDHDNLARLFDMSDTGQSGSPLLRGADIGLILARLIAGKHNGYVEAISEAGRGVTFALYLPVAEG